MNEKPKDHRIEFGGAMIALVASLILFAVIFALWMGVVGAIIVTTVLSLILIAALVIWSGRRTHPPDTDAPHVTPVDDDRYRILVIADDTCTPSTLVGELRSRASSRSALVFVMAPALESRFGLLADDQGGYERGTARLTEILDALNRAGLPAQGGIGQADPLQAADDGLRQFPADEIVFVTNPEGKTNWLEEGVVAMAESRFDQPVTHIAVPT